MTVALSHPLTSPQEETSSARGVLSSSSNHMTTSRSSVPWENANETKKPPRKTLQTCILDVTGQGGGACACPSFWAMACVFVTKPGRVPSPLSSGTCASSAHQAARCPGFLSVYREAVLDHPPEHALRFRCPSLHTVFCRTKMHLGKLGKGWPKARGSPRLQLGDG